MLAIYAEGMWLGYSGRMTSHQNEKDRWSRHYSCSQNFSSFALFGTKHPLLRSDVRWFCELNLGNDYELIVTSSFTATYRGFIFLTGCLPSVYPCCFHPVSAMYTMKDEKMECGLTEKSEAVSVIAGKQFSDCKVFDPAKGKISSMILSCGLKCSIISASLTTQHRERQNFIR